MIRPVPRTWLDTTFNCWKAELVVGDCRLECGAQSEPEAVEAIWRLAASSARENGGQLLALMETLWDGRREERWAEIEEISAALDTIDNPWVRLRLLERLLELEEASALDAHPYHYYQSRKYLARDLAEVYLTTNQWTKAQEWALTAERPDVAARAAAGGGDFAKAFSFLEQSEFTLSKSLGRSVGRRLIQLFGEGVTEASISERWPRLAQRLSRKFGNWNTFLHEVRNNIKEAWLPEAAPACEALSMDPLDWRALLAKGRALADSAASDRASIESCQGLATGGKFPEAEVLAREILQSTNQFKSELERTLLELLLVQERYDELLDHLDGRYLGNDRDFYLNLKIVLDREIHGEDLVSNFFYLIRRRSVLYDKVPAAFAEEANVRLQAFARAHGVDPFRLFASQATVGDPAFTWRQHGFQSVGKLPRSIKSRFLEFHYFCGSRLEEEWLKPLLDDLDAAVRQKVGAFETSERWLSERALAAAVIQRFPSMKVQCHDSPRWLTPQHLDIFIPEISTAIEYMGQQHYGPVDFFGGPSAFLQTVRRDTRKRELCEVNGVRLLYVRFDEDWSSVFLTLDQIARGESERAL